jgi:hypothetical protein
MEDVNEQGEDFGISFPANARIASLDFGDGDLRVHLDDGGSERIVSPKAIAAIHGATIRREGVHPAPLDTSSFVERVMGKEGSAVSEEIQYVIAMRATSVGELWYLVADTFNFRKTLGAEATNIFDQNLRALVRKLTTYAPQAVQDGFIAAMLADLPLPPALVSLMEFFRVVSR